MARALLLTTTLFCAIKTTYARHAPSHRKNLHQRVRFLHTLVASHLCSPGVDLPTDTGAWCLTAGNETAFGHPLASQHYLDEGIAASLLTLVRHKTVLDVGAGSGQYGRYFDAHNAGVVYSAIDGALNVETFTDGYVQWADLVLPYWRDGGPADWVVSLEVGEHIPERYESAFFDNLHRNNRCGVVLSWAVPGQSGRGHVNCRDNEYVTSAMRRLGYVLDVEATKMGRARADKFWFRNTYMVFRRKEVEGC